MDEEDENPKNDAESTETEDLSILDSGVKINLISSRKLDTMSSQQKLRFILDEVKKGTVLVLERGLTAVEEIDLIKATMSEIDHQTFIGIEMQSYSSDDVKASTGWFSKLIGRARVPRMSVIGPANLLKTIQKNGTMIQAMILTGKTIVNESSSVGSEDVGGDAEQVSDAPLAEPVISDEDAVEEDEDSSDEDVAEAEDDSDIDESPPLAEPVADINDDQYEDDTEQTIDQKDEQEEQLGEEQIPETVASDKEDTEESDDENSEEGSSFLYKRLKNDEE
jgi:hypothetical protein